MFSKELADDLSQALDVAEKSIVDQLLEQERPAQLAVTLDEHGKVQTAHRLAA